MNCLELRRLLLAAPREQSLEQRAHIARCEDCARLARQLVDLDRDIGEAALVPAPEALTQRILLTPHPRPSWQYAAAAAFAVVSAAVGLLASGVVEAPGFAGTMQAVGPTHPAVVAIAEVADEEGALAKEPPAHDPAELEEGLKRLGLTLKQGEASAHYVGKCRIDGSSDCEHIVLSTLDAHADVMLVADYPMPDRVLVADRRMFALVNPAGTGAYIVIADSAKIARRMEKLLVKS